jgi:hypothetical protein
MSNYLFIKRLFFIAVIIATFSISAFTQNNTSSPLSILGVGEIEYRSIGRTTGMGNAGIGYHSNNFLNRRNPAGLSGIDTLVFILDVSAGMKLSEFRTKSLKERTSDFNFHSLAAGLRMLKIWTGSVGLAPYSNVGYNILRTEAILGTLNDFYDINFSGTGGINRFYWANAVELFKGFSVGVNSSYYFGSISHTESTNFLTITSNQYINKIHFDFGLLYTRVFGNYTKATVGGIYGYETDNIIARNKTIENSGVGILLDRPESAAKMKLPEKYGAGFSITRAKTREWVLAADWEFQKWSANTTTHKSLKYTDSHTYNIGLQFTPNVARPENYFQVMRYHIGACYNQSYLAINGYQLKDYSVSFGVGAPFLNRSFVSVAMNLGQSGTGKRGGITERYALVTINLSLIEQWFAKYQYD